MLQEETEDATKEVEEKPKIIVSARPIYEASPHDLRRWFEYTLFMIQSSLCHYN